MSKFQINLELCEHPAWVRADNTSVSGAAFEGQKLKQNETLCNHFADVQDENEFIAAVSVLNGFFAVIQRSSGQLFAAVDRVRSIPLFYAEDSSIFYLSDNPTWIQKQMGTKQTDLISAGELLLAGYVTGTNTLDPRIKQIQAGEALIVSEVGTGFEAAILEYARFHHHHLYQYSEDHLLKLLDEITVDSIERLLRWADGRQIAIPLSGGLDSRLIAMTIKRLGYDNYVAFSYGLPENSESRISREVAKQLHIPWYFVEYNRDRWHQWYHSDVYREYVQYSERLVSLVHIQDWPAVMELTQKGIISDDAVFVPGHSGDFLAGKQIPLCLIRGGTEKDMTHLIAKSVWQRHYTFRDVASVASDLGVEKAELYNALKTHIVEHFDGFDLGSKEGAVNAYNFEFWQEWLTKVLVNSMRVYEFWGHAWWLPYYDAGFISFWEHIPLYYRRNKRLYNRYVGQQEQEAGISVESYGPSSTERVIRGIERWLALWESGYKIYRKSLRLPYKYKHNSLAWYGIVGYRKYTQLFKHGGGSINTIVTADQIQAHMEDKL